MEDSEVFTAAVEVASTAATVGAITVDTVAATTAGHPIVALMPDQERCTAVHRMGCMEVLHRHEAPLHRRRAEALLAMRTREEVPARPLQPPARQPHTRRLPMGNGIPSPTVTRLAVAWAVLLHRRAAPGLTWEPALTARRRTTWPHPAIQPSPMGSGTPWEAPMLRPGRPDRRDRGDPPQPTSRLTQPWPRTRMQC